MSTVKNGAIIDVFGEKIKQRSENIAQTAEKRKYERQLNSCSTENSDYFLENFEQLKKVVESKLLEAKTVEKSNIISYLDEVVEDVGKMQSFLNECSMFLPSFQIKIAQETINLTNERVQECIKELQPKKKFGFKSKKCETVKPKVNKDRDTVDSSVGFTSLLTEQLKEKIYFGFKDKRGETLVKSEEELQNRQLNLANLDDCKVLALGNPSSLQFSNLRDSTVIIGPTSRSALIKDCINCTFVLACQQVRIHNTENSKFYLYVTGAAIIENCKNLQFGPYTLQYSDLEKHFEESALATNINNWKNIDDFHWLNENEKSPNFSLINEENWERDWLDN